MKLLNTFTSEFLELVSDSDSEDDKQSVVIWFDYGIESDDPFYELGDKLANMLTETGVGYYDGHEMEINNKDGSYYMYGPNAEMLFKTVKPLLEKYDFIKGSTAVLTFGQGTEGRLQIEVEL